MNYCMQILKEPLIPKNIYVKQPEFIINLKHGNIGFSKNLYNNKCRFTAINSIQLTTLFGTNLLNKIISSLTPESFLLAIAKGLISYCGIMTCNAIQNFCASNSTSDF